MESIPKRVGSRSLLREFMDINRRQLVTGDNANKNCDHTVAIKPPYSRTSNRDHDLIECEYQIRSLWVSRNTI